MSNSKGNYTEAIIAFATSAAPSSAAENAKLITSNISQRWSQSDVSPDDLEGDLWGLWSGFTATAKDPSCVKSDALARAVQLLGAIKAQGVLEKDGKPCQTQLGSVWTDLPYFGAEMRETWNAQLPADQWAGLNAFAALVTAANVSDFSLYGIWSLRETLEEERAFTTRETGAGDSVPKSPESVPVSELVPAAAKWLEDCGEQMLQWCKAGRSYGTSPDPSKLGPKAVQAGVQQSGYNMERWAFWKDRFHQIAELR